MTRTTVVVVLVLSASWASWSGGARRSAVRLRRRLGGDVPLPPSRPRAASGRVAARLDGLFHRHEVRVERDLPAALEGIARSLRAGASIQQALGEAARRSVPPLADDLAAVDRRLESGVPLDEALVAWSASRSVVGVRLSVAALRLSSRLGGSGARAVDRLARSLRDRRAVQRELGVLAAQAKLSASVIVVAPLVFGVLGAAVDGRAAAFLFTTPVGLGCLVSAVALDAVAAVWMGRIVRAVPL